MSTDNKTSALLVLLTFQAIAPLCKEISYHFDNASAAGNSESNCCLISITPRLLVIIKRLDLHDFSPML